MWQNDPPEIYQMSLEGKHCSSFTVVYFMFCVFSAAVFPPRVESVETSKSITPRPQVYHVGRYVQAVFCGGAQR